MNKKKRTMVCVVAVMLLLSIIVGVTIALIPQKEQEIPETSESTTKTAPQESSQTDLGETSAVQTQDQTEADDYEDNREEERETAEPIPKIAFDEGNEAYLDMDVVSRLEAMEKAEGDARVNKILDAIIMLINKFEDKGYSSKAIKQIQRFYFTCHDKLMAKDFEYVSERLEVLISAIGASSNSFAERAYDLLGIDTATDYSYIFEVRT